MHQFDKVEMVKFRGSRPFRRGARIMTANAEAILQRLGSRYRVVLLASGTWPLPQRSATTWRSGAAEWGGGSQVSSCSNFRDFQARRAGIRMRPATGGKTGYAHTLNDRVSLGPVRDRLSVSKTIRPNAEAFASGSRSGPIWGAPRELS